MAKPDLLILGPMMPMIMDGLGEHFTTHKLWEAADASALIATLGPAIKAVAAGGASKQRVDAGLLDRLPNLRIVLQLWCRL